MAFPRGIFKAYDIRGLLDQVTPEIAEQVGRAMVAKFGAKTVLVGRDMRETSPQLAEALMNGVTAMGGNVIDIGMTTTSLFNWAVSTLDVEMGVMVTASHNPATYNGMKIGKADGQPVSGDEMYDMVHEVFEDGAAKGSIEARDVRDVYLDAVIAAVGELPDFSGMNIVIDYGNGMGSVTVRALLQRLGVAHEELYGDPDATFPNHEANPAKESTLVDLKTALAEGGAQIGVAVDGDGDRIGFVDETGVTLRGDQTLAILATHFLEREPGAKIVVAPNHGWASTDYMKNLGADLQHERIGRTYAIRKMRDVGAVVGGEISSHFFYKQFSELESIDYTLALLLCIIKKSGKTLAELAAPLRAYVNSGEVNIEVEYKEEAIARVKEVYAAQATEVNTLDGIRCDFGKDWWFILRASNTEPLIRLTVEAKSMDLMNEKVEEISKVILGT